MGTALEKEWKRLLIKEEKMLFAAENKRETKLDGKIREITGMIEEKIPEKLSDTLDAAFYKGFLLLTMALVLCLGTLAMGGQKGVQTTTYYECVQVQKGDTLWEIAEEYKMDGTDTEQMVDEIMEVNGLKNTNVRTGESIIVPVTKAV